MVRQKVRAQSLLFKKRKKKQKKKKHCNQKVRRTQFYLKINKQTYKQINKQTNMVRQKVRTRFLLFKKITW